MKLDLFKGESGSYFLINGMTALSFAFIIPVTLLVFGNVGIKIWI